ncbi:MAG: DUF2231 domain-containing protein [Gemmatimonadales bacterium]
MPEMGPIHPIIVHFVIALLVMGVIFRIISLTGKASFTGPAATTLLLIGGISTVFAAESGHDAHGPAERVPGVRQAVEEHEEWGERTRNLFLAVVVLEIGALALAKRRFGRHAVIASAALGALGLGAIYETGEHGGDLVYSYAGGVGTRTGDEADIEHLLMAGLYHQSMADREAGHHEAAARLIDEMVRRSPDDPAVRLMSIESMIVDRHDAEEALAALSAFPIPQDNRRLKYRVGLLMTDAFVAKEEPDSARATLQQLLADFPDNQRVKDRIARLK